MQKWEYIELISRDYDEYYTIIENSGQKRLKFSKNQTGMMVINNLGRQGWEMIDFQKVDPCWHYHFKRPLE